jgi:bifunctional enzyme CysN/CysC/sulfate adenylyltransferase subunit 1
LHDFRGLSGQIAGGIVRVGQPVIVLPGGMKTKVKEIWTLDGPLQEAFCPQSVTLVLEHDIDISRGDTILGMDSLPGFGSDLRAQVCWMHARTLQPGKKFFLKHTTQTVQAIVTSLDSRMDIHTFEPELSPVELGVNEVGEIRLKTARPLTYDGYSENRLTGSFILIEQGTNATVGAGMLHPPIQPISLDFADFSI